MIKPFTAYYRDKYPSGTATDYIEWDYYSNPETDLVNGNWLDKQLEEAFEAGKQYQKEKEYEFWSFGQ